MNPQTNESERKVNWEVIELEMDKIIICPECEEEFEKHSGCECGISYLDVQGIEDNNNDQNW